VRVVVELLGTARIAAGRAEVTLDLPAHVTGRDVIMTLLRKMPALKGKVIDPKKRELIYPQLLGDSTGKTIHDLDASLELEDGARFFVFQEPC